MFPGQGAQYVNMGAELYRTEPVFKQEVDHCSEILLPWLGMDLREAMYPSAENAKAAEELLLQTRITQPALFVVSYALARLWMSWGIKPRAMIGHSVGEYVAGCLAGVFSLQDALMLVAARAKLVQAQPPGVMLAVRLPEQQVKSQLTDELSMAALNSPNLCVVSGPAPAVERLEDSLTKQRVPTKRLPTSHAFHSAMMDPVVAPLTELLRTVKLNEPAIPYVSNVTGRWITGAEAKDPAYWAAHVRQTVRFADGMATLAKQSGSVLLEVGPGQSLSAFARQHSAWLPGHTVLSSLPVSKEHEQAAMLSALGRLWIAGVAVDWSGFHQLEKRRRVSLPTYPFERKRYWVEPVKGAAQPTAGAAALEETPASPILEQSQSNAPQPAMTRKDRILAMVAAQFQKISGANAGLSSSARFAEIGLDSLLLAQASQMLQKKFGIQIAFRRLLDDLSTLNDLAGFLDQALPSDFAAAEPVAPTAPQATPAQAQATNRDSAMEAMQAQLQALTSQLDTLRQAMASAPRGENAAPPAPAGPTELPLTESQKELWLASQASQDASCVFNQLFSIHLDGLINEEALRNILQELVDHHDALRTTFASDGTSQKISACWKIGLPSRDLSALSEADQERELAEAMRREDQTPFDLENGPLIRAQLFKLSASRCVLALAAHHIILDGWSMGVLLREFSQLYEACEQGTTARLEPAMQHREFLQWQSSAQHRAAVEASEAYWLNRFAKLPNDLELPADRPRPSVKTYRAAERQLLLDASFYRSLKEAAAGQDCTLFVLLLAGLKAWLFRLTGEEDLIIGVPAAGQLAVSGHPGSNYLVGHCVNTLPVRSRCDGDARFSDHLRTVKSTMLDAHEHQNLTLGTLVRKLNLRTDLSRAPFVPLVFNLSRASRGLRLPKARTVFPPKTFSFFDLGIEARDSGKDLRIVCRYNAGLFDDARIERMLNQFQTLLKAAAENPERKVMDLPLLTDAERRQILVEWNRTEAAYSRNRCVHEFVGDQARSAPEAVAAVFKDKRLTYRELDERSNQMAHCLKKLGVGPDIPVGICVERSLDMLVCVLGTFKAGGAYMPLDSEYPKERLAFMVGDARAPVLLTQKSLREKIPAGNARVICLDGDRGLFESESMEAPKNTAGPDNLAYILYTSGSTGQPKGVAMVHRAVANLISWQCASPSFSGGLRTLQFAPLGFDVSFQEMFSTWCSKGTLVVVPEELRRDFDKLLRFLTEQQVERLFLPFVALEHLAETAVEQGMFPLCLREIITAGEQLQVTPSLQTFFEKLPRCTLENQYGPTEAHVVSAYTMTGPPGQWPKLPPVGKPIWNTTLYVLDRGGQPTPIGAPGELHIGGIALARGYYNRPELTAQKFIADPFAAKPGSRLYRTGDLARYLADGNIEFLGRMDQQVKIRGFRIELGEIESVLAGLPGVREAVVVAREDVRGEKRLVAYLTGKEGELTKISELRGLLKAKLPEYMVPAAFVTLDALPLSPNGKVDRKALPKPDFESAADQFAPPITATEIALAKIWSEILGVKRVGLRDNFFELGGHSLLATKMISRIRSAYHINLALASLFQNPTLAGLVSVVDQRCMEEMQPDELSRILLEIESTAKDQAPRSL
jgi:amino acid adenylation domain-containing protein